MVDMKTLKVTATWIRWATKGGGPGGLAVNAKNHILFAMCHNPGPTCVVLDAERRQNSHGLEFRGQFIRLVRTLRGGSA